MSLFTMQFLAAQLAEDLALRTGLTVVQGVDASNNPTLAMGTATTGLQYAFIRLRPQPAITKTSLGLDSGTYAPHVIECVLETSATAATSYLTEANSLKLFGELCKHGTKVQVYLSTNTEVPDVDDITATKLAVTFDNLRQPGTATM
jgi:hypothetical protein